MKKAILLFLLFSNFLALGQTIMKSENRHLYKEIPGEEIFVHYNTSVLFTGEYLYYKIYNRNLSTGLLSSLSKIAYIELLGEDGTQIFKHKIKLNKGIGQGDFFLPTTVPSGNYKLVAYTRWMLNDKENFFGGDIAVVNPYRGDQSAISLPEGIGNNWDSQSIEISSTTQVSKGPIVDSRLILNWNRSKIGQREKMLLSIRPNGNSVGGYYSISVRKIEDLNEPPMIRVGDLKTGSHKLKEDIEISKPIYLPELRGELITGRILPKNADAPPLLTGKNISLSIPGVDYLIKVARTNDEGEFFFNLDGDYSGSQAFFEIIGEDKELFKIEIFPIPGLDHTQLKYHKFYLSPEMKEMILNRSIYNQIENSYYGVKPDTLPIPDQRPPFYEKTPIIYDLDDYTRFPLISETFTEIIREAAVRGNQVMVRVPTNAVDYGMASLLIVDGMVVQDHKSFLNTPSTEIKSIAVLPYNYYLGPQMFQGVVDIVTVDNHYWDSNIPAHVKEYFIDKPQPFKRYFHPNYSQEKKENIPDFRYQLLWEPNLKIDNNEEIELEFFTGEVRGNFEIILQGLTEIGLPIYTRDIFTVE